LQLIVAQVHFDKIDTSDLLIERNRAAVEVPIRYRHRETGVPFVSTKATISGRWKTAGRSGRRVSSGLRQRRRRRPSGMRG
jgi:hypothetical protein